MAELNKQLPWEVSHWNKECSEWIRASLKSHGIEMLSEPVLIHSTPWSLVHSVQTNRGCFYFKALCPVLIYEPAVSSQLYHWQPDLIQPVLDIDRHRGWMLMPDGGSTLRQVLEKTPSLNYWKKILPLFARFQQAMIPHQKDLLALGVQDRRLQVLSDLSIKLAADSESLCIGKPYGLSTLEYETLQGSIPTLKKMCSGLAQFDIPETLQHDDFHDGNIFVVQNGFRFFDWAESFIAHPFFSMVVTLRSIAYRFKLEDDSATLHELEDIYLLEWLDYASLKNLHDAFDLAMVIGRINRALTWHMVVSSLPEPYRSKEADTVPGWVKLFLEKISLYA